MKQRYVIPPEQNAEFVAHMEDVLEVYHRPYDPKRPVLCMDEQPVQLIKETRVPLPAVPGRPECVDYEYERSGPANIFLFTEPLAGWRKTSVRPRETAVDWAEEIRRLLEEDYAEAETVVLVCDNLNTHKIASLYEAFPPEVARRLVGRLEIRYTPKHGSWLNIAETELSVLTRQCLDRRIPDQDTLLQERLHGTRIYAEIPFPSASLFLRGIKFELSFGDVTIDGWIVCDRHLRANAISNVAVPVDSV